MRFCDLLEHKEQPIALRQPFFDTPPAGVNALLRLKAVQGQLKNREKLFKQTEPLI
jgi:hypothetical protein